MMKNKLNHILCICLLASFITHSQNKKLKRANKYFENLEYSKAIVRYENLVSKGDISVEIYQKLGDANYLNANYEEAAKWYQMLSQTNNQTMEVEHVYRYAQSLKSIQKYQKSDQLMEKLSEMAQNDQRALTFLNSMNYLDKIKKNSGKYSIENIAINSTSSDFAPSFIDKGLVFSTGRDTSGVSKIFHSWNKKRFLSLFVSTTAEDGSLRTPIKFTKALNTQVHESSTAFTKDGKMVYFTRNNEKGGRFSRDKKGVSRLKIYSAYLENGEWKNIKPLPFNSDDYSVAHPSLNKAETKLYFSSDMPGTVGNSDIYVVDILKDGSFGIPQNLGKKINTESKETFPFITDEGVLYFASDGHPGLGGLDVFATDLKDMDAGYIVNVGEPINSTADDFSLIINTATKKGYFASNRSEGKGDDDIYALVQLDSLKLKCSSVVSGTVKDKNTGALLSNTKVVLMTSNGEKFATTNSDTKGAFSFDINCQKADYKVIATKKDYEKGDTSFLNKGADQTASVELVLVQIDMGAPIGTDLAKYLNVEPIYFDFDQWDIRSDAEASIQKIITYLNTYPNTKVRIGSHTDSRASKAYNIRLSNKRANSTMEYLIKKGINLFV